MGSDRDSIIKSVNKKNYVFFLFPGISYSNVILRRYLVPSNFCGVYTNDFDVCAISNYVDLCEVNSSVFEACWASWTIYLMVKRFLQFLHSIL